MPLEAIRMSRRQHGGLGLLAGLGLLVGAGLLCACHAHPAEPLVQASPVSLQESQPDRVRLGALRFEAGFALGAADPRFGGLSGLWLAPDGHELIMASDRGTIWRAALEHEDDRLIGFAEWQAAALGRAAGDPDGRIDAEALADDAEALADDAAGGLIVAVEGALPLRRIARDDLRVPAEPLPADRLREAVAKNRNAGIEALATLPDGGLLALSEGVFAAPGQLAAWLVEDGRVTPLRYVVSDAFVPTGADRLDDTIYIVERRFSLLDGGFASRVVALDIGQIREGGLLSTHPLAQLGRPAISENFEGIAVRRAMDGRALIYLVSDDNFLPLQRTLLLQFSLAGP
jgi:hypothetical protein